MKTIMSSSVNEIVIKNSRFITLLFEVFDDTNISNIIEKAKKDYPKATHYCYAYITKTLKKSSDDGEPGGTAGAPMLNVLEKESMMNIFAITIRYFGGIKLGAGGLVRAYTKSVREALQKSDLVEIINGFLIKISVSYDEQKDLDYILRNSKIVNKDYMDMVTYMVLIAQNNIDILSNYSYQIISEEYIIK